MTVTNSVLVAQHKEKTSQIATGIIALAMFVTGLTGLVYEYILSTVATNILGNSVEQFSITIGLMLFMMGVGGVAQKYISDEKAVSRFIGIEMLIALLGGYAALVMYASYGLLESHFALVQYFFIMSIGFLVGFEVPLAIRIAQSHSQSLPKNLAVIFFLDYVGAFVGAILFSRVLLRSFSLTEMSFMLAGTNLAVGILAYAYFGHGHWSMRKLGGVFAITCIGGALVWGYIHNGRWSAVLEQRLYKDKIVFAKTSAYQRMVLTHNKVRKEHRLYLNGNLQFCSLDEVRYHELLVHVPMVLAPSAQNVLILGGGDGMALREVLKYPELASVTLVDLDPEMTRVASTHPVFTALNRNAFADARVKVLKTGAISEGAHTAVVQDGQVSPRAKRARPESVQVATVSVLNMDADKFVGEIHGVYDVVIVDFPDPRSIEVAKLYSKEFYLKLQRVLSDTGVISVQSTSPYYAKEPYLMIGRTMQAAGYAVIPYHHDVPAFGDWGWHLAWKSSLEPSTVREKISALQGFSVDTEFVTPDVVRKAFIFGKNDLTSAFPEEINTLMFPKLLQRYRESWVID